MDNKRNQDWYMTVIAISSGVTDLSRECVSTRVYRRERYPTAKERSHWYTDVNESSQIQLWTTLRKVDNCWESRSFHTSVIFNIAVKQ